MAAMIAQRHSGTSPVHTEWSDLEKNPSKEMLQLSKDSGYGTADHRSKKSPQEQDDEAMNFLALDFPQLM